MVLDVILKFNSFQKKEREKERKKVGRIEDIIDDAIDQPSLFHSGCTRRQQLGRFLSSDFVFRRFSFLPLDLFYAFSQVSSSSSFFLV